MSKTIEGIFPQNLKDDLIRAKLKEIDKLQDVVKLDDLSYKSKRGKTCFSRNINEVYLSLENSILSKVILLLN